MTRVDDDGWLVAVRKKWDVVMPPEARWYAVAHTRRGRARLIASLRDLPVGAHVVLCDGWPFSRKRCRKIAVQAEIKQTRCYVALPTLSASVALLQDDRATARYVASTLLVAPLRFSWRARWQRLLVPIARAFLVAPTRSAVFTGRLILGERA